MSSCIFVIDMQNDFVRKDGRLSVYSNGGEKAVDNTVSFIKRNIGNLDKLFFSQDCHPNGHIGSTSFWIDTEANSNVAPYTRITIKDVEDGKYTSVIDKRFFIPYMKKIEADGDCITAWPPHCIEGSVGAEFHSAFDDILSRYRSKTKIIKKGKNRLFEQYSPIVSEAMVVMDEVMTIENNDLLDELDKYDTIYLCGVATDFCVKNTVKDILSLRKGIIPKIVIMKDCVAPVSKDFNIENDRVYKEAIELGARVIDSDSI